MYKMAHQKILEVWIVGIEHWQAIKEFAPLKTYSNRLIFYYTFFYLTYEMLHLKVSKVTL
jgi:hypothetical protein